MRLNVMMYVHFLFCYVNTAIEKLTSSGIVEILEGSKTHKLTSLNLLQISRNCLICGGTALCHK